MTSIVLPEPDPAAPRATTAEGGDVQSQGSALRLFARTFIENKLAVVGLALIVIIILFSWVGPHLYHTDQQNPALILGNGQKGTSAPPQATRPLGADNNGFDIIGRLMLGGQI